MLSGASITKYVVVAILRCHLWRHMQIHSNTIPFVTLNEYQIVRCVTNGERPERLGMPRMEDAEWDLVRLCWGHNPYARPTIEQVMETMKSIGDAPRS